MIKVLIGDDNREIADIIKEFISQEEDIEVCGAVHNGNEVLKAIKILSPDIVVLDIVMPELDGLGVLEQLQELDIKAPKIIMLSSFSQEMITKKVAQLGASYFLMKPFDLNVLVERIRQVFETPTVESLSEVVNLKLAENNNTFNIDNEITKLIRDLGIPPHIRGYHFVKAAINLVIKDHSVLESITGELYPRVADQFKTTPGKTERAIRHAITVAWDRGNKEAIIDIFGGLQATITKPTNSEFIATMVEKVQYDMRA